MDKRVIIYKTELDEVAVIYPVQEYIDIFGIETLAKKDTPAGLPFWIVDKSIIPSDRTFRDAWRIDDSYGEPDGYGHAEDSFEGVLLNDKD